MINIKEKFGYIPCSIMTFKTNKKLLKLIGDDKSNIIKKNEKSTGILNNKNFSTFNPEIIKFLIEYYTLPTYTILDPFMGRGSRSVVSSILKRKYIGIDVCKKTCELNKELNKEYKNNNKYILGDGTSSKILLGIKERVDCVISCPPYYNKEKYSGSKGDLSYLKKKEYDKQINNLFENLYKIIPKSDYKKKIFYPVIFVVGSIRNTNKGLLDMDRIFQNIAFKNKFILHDKIIINDENTFKITRFTHKRNYECKYVAKNYETILIFIKY